MPCLKRNKSSGKHVYGERQGRLLLKKYIHELFDKVKLEEQRMVVNKCHALKLIFADTFQHDFSMFHFSPSAVSCFQVWNRLREKAKLSFDIWERGDWAAAKSILDFFNLHIYSPINSHVDKYSMRNINVNFKHLKLKAS